MTKTFEELNTIATEISQYITIRTYENGCSKDTTRKALKKERETIYNIVRAALGMLNEPISRKNEDITRAILLTAELTADYMLKDVNGYDTVYLPLRKVLKNWDD